MVRSKECSRKGRKIFLLPQGTYGKESRPEWHSSPHLLLAAASHSTLKYQMHGQERYCWALPCLGTWGVQVHRGPAPQLPRPCLKTGRSRTADSTRASYGACHAHAPQGTRLPFSETESWASGNKLSSPGRALKGGVRSLSTPPPSREPPPTRRPNTTVAKKPPMKPSQVFFGDSYGWRANS